MPYELLPTLLIQILLVGYTPGPANIYALSTSLRFGRRIALRMWLGLLTGFSVGMLTMATLTHLVGIAFGAYINSLKYLGGAYILYLAYKMLHRQEATAEKSAGSGFGQGMLVQLTNAKMLLFELTVFGAFVLPYSRQFVDLLKVGAWLFIAGPGANLVWLLAGSSLRPAFANHGKLINIVSAVALALCACYVVLS